MAVGVGVGVGVAVGVGVGVGVGVAVGIGVGVTADGAAVTSSTQSEPEMLVPASPIMNPTEIMRDKSIAAHGADHPARTKLAHGT